MSLDLSGLSGSLASALPSSGAILDNVILGAATSVVLSGLKQQAGSGALDPLGLFPHNTANAPVAPTNNPNITNGPTITASAFASLPPASQASLLAAGAHILAG